MEKGIPPDIGKVGATPVRTGGLLVKPRQADIDKLQSKLADLTFDIKELFERVKKLEDNSVPF